MPPLCDPVSSRWPSQRFKLKLDRDSKVHFGEVAVKSSLGNTFGDSAMNPNSDRDASITEQPFEAVQKIEEPEPWVIPGFGFCCLAIEVVAISLCDCLSQFQWRLIPSWKYWYWLCRS